VSGAPAAALARGRRRGAAGDFAAMAAAVAIRTVVISGAGYFVIPN
jgi:hypothetical protein